MMMVIAKVFHECLHHWPEAPYPVEYLKYPHRHVFEFTVWVEVVHYNRQVEVIQLKHALSDICKAEFFDDAGAMSCENMASIVSQQLTQAGYRVKRVRVLEDSENGAEWQE